MRPVRHLTATAYLRKMRTGRTNPAIFECDDLNGNDVGQFVVKLKAGLENGGTGLTCELLSSLVAAELGLMTAPLALVEIDPTLSGLISEKDSDMRKIVKNSAGMNFATEALVGGYGTWPVDKAIPISARQLASEIFSFDALIQNPDRRVNNPNLLWKDDEIFVIDHDLAFSFLYQLGESNSPWDLKGSDFDFLNDHVFYKQLKGQNIDLDRFNGALQAISAETIDQMTEEVPPEWTNENVSKISKHLKDLRDHSSDFVEQLKWRLV